MHISDYFDPVPAEVLEEIKPGEPGQWSNFAEIFTAGNGFPGFENKEIAIIGVGEDRNASSPQNASAAPDEIRKYFYRLFPSGEYHKLIDLGNMKPGNTVEDTYFSLTETVKILYEYGIIPVIAGGSQDLTFAVYKAFEEMKRLVNLVSIDAKIDIGSFDLPLNETNFISHILRRKPNYLFHFSNLAYQSYLNDYKYVNLVKEFFFDVFRLGKVRQDILHYESFLRNSDILSFDISAVRFAGAPGQNSPSPNGLYAEEACQLAYYAGLSEKMSVAGFFNFNPGNDIHGQTAHLIAQLIWHFVQGVSDRYYESPWQTPDKFTRYTVNLNHGFIVFFRSKESKRWWMEIPVPPHKKERYGENILVPCTGKDYEYAAQNGEIPELYLNTMKKLH